MQSNSKKSVVEESRNIMELCTIQTNVLKTLFEGIKEIITEANIIFTPRGIELYALEQSHTMIINLILDSDKFEKYECKNNEVIGLNIMNFYKILKHASNDDIISLYINENDRSKLKIKRENSIKKYITTHELNVIEPTNELDKLNIDFFDKYTKTYTESIIIKSDEFQKICKEMTTISENIELQKTKNQLIIKCSGDYATQETIINNITSENPEYLFQSHFSAKYLTSCNKFSSLCNTTKIYLDNKQPLLLIYQVGSLGELKIALAPKINT